jgi:hypothetical protein
MRRFLKIASWLIASWLIASWLIAMSFIIASLIPFLSTSYLFFPCDIELTNAVQRYKVATGMSYFEMFHEIDLNNNKCIDIIEMNALIDSLGISWGCSWPGKVIVYFTQDKDIENNLNKKINQCIEWNDFKRKIRELNDKTGVD